MIGWLEGQIKKIKPMEMLLNVGGVGYFLSIPFSTFSEIKDQDACSLYVYTHVREDQIRLFGFKTEKEKKFFETLIKVNGVGPSMALSILSAVSFDVFVNCVKTGDAKSLTSIPGIGKTKAEKLIFELKRKIKSLDTTTDVDLDINNDGSDAIDALVSLGFDEKKVSSVVNDLIREGDHFTVEDIIKKSLKILSSFK